MHVCDFTTTQISSKYVHEQHIDHSEMRLNLINLRIEMYPVEGPMLKAPVTPVLLMVSCSKSRTTVGAERCTQCSPSNVYRKVDDLRKKN